MNSILLEALKYSKLDLTELYLIPSSGSSSIEQIFDISPKDFLRFAKEDLQEDNERGFINSISNAKRAIDCQIDEVIEKLASDSNDFTPLVKDFLKYFEFELDIPIKLQIIHALNFAPSLIISKSRTLRNKLEHIYQKPNIQEVKEALDVADLFLRSVTGKLIMIWDDFEIVDGKSDTEIKFLFNLSKRNFKLVISKKNIIEKTYFIGLDNLEYWGLLRLMLSIDDDVEIKETFKILMKQICHPIPLEKVNICQSN